jgi:hypothetical protein
MKKVGKPKVGGSFLTRSRSRSQKPGIESRRVGDEEDGRSAEVDCGSDGCWDAAVRFVDFCAACGVRDGRRRREGGPKKQGRSASSAHEPRQHLSFSQRRYSPLAQEQDIQYHARERLRATSPGSAQCKWHSLVHRVYSKKAYRRSEAVGHAGQ